MATLNHILNMDNKFVTKPIDLFRKDQLYFQRLFPKWRAHYDGTKNIKSVFYYESTDNDEVREISHKDAEDPFSALSWFRFSVSRGRTFYNTFNTPVFVFGNKNKKFSNYLDAIGSSVVASAISKKHVSGWSYWERSDAPDKIRDLLESSNEPLIPDSLRQEQEFAVPIIHAPDVPILRWCHSELAIVPTKKSLRVLFFEN